MAAVVGLVQGGVQSLSRSLFGRLVPAGKSARILRLLQHGGQVRHRARPGIDGRGGAGCRQHARVHPGAAAAVRAGRRAAVARAIRRSSARSCAGDGSRHARRCAESQRQVLFREIVDLGACCGQPARRATRDGARCVMRGNCHAAPCAARPVRSHGRASGSPGRARRAWSTARYPQAPCVTPASRISASCGSRFSQCPVAATVTSGLARL